VKSLSISSILAIVIMGFSGLANAWITKKTTISKLSVYETGVTIVEFADNSQNCHIESDSKELFLYAQNLYITQRSVKALCHDKPSKSDTTDLPSHKLYSLTAI
jgi:hypothetical protein